MSARAACSAGLGLEASSAREEGDGDAMHVDSAYRQPPAVRRVWCLSTAVARETQNVVAGHLASAVDRTVSGTQLAEWCGGGMHCFPAKSENIGWEIDDERVGDT